MKKRVSLLALALSLLLCTAVQAQSTEASPFVRSRSYEAQFSDVAAGQWYHDAVAALYEYGLTNGIGSGKYAPGESISVAELVTFSARVHALYAGESIDAAGAEPWYQPYVDYLKANGLLDAGLDGHFTETATRAQMAGIFADTLPESWYDNRNADIVTRGYAEHQFIKDVTDYTPYQQDILWLYKQGIAGGVNASGAFHPGEAVTRSEIAALLTRMIDPSLRLTLDWKILSYRSAAGTTFADLVTAPDAVVSDPASTDTAAIDALVRKMLRSDSPTIMLEYANGLTADDTAKLARAFTVSVKRYCEQMYNSATCRAYASGRAYLTFSSTACDSAQLAAYRQETIERAAAIHDELWESGYLTADMNQYELAKAYYIWLCDNCIYDDGAVGNDSISHLAYGALVKGVAVCDGYTGAYNLLLGLEGISCTSLFNDTHIWTVAELDGTSYHIDTTWGDQNGKTDMSFFGMTEAQSRTKHSW